MLNSKAKLLVRFLFCVFSCTLIFAAIEFTKSRLNHAYKFNDKWTYELSYRFTDFFKLGLFIFSLFCILYFLSIIIFKHYFNSFRRKAYFSVLLSIILPLFYLISGIKFSSAIAILSVLVGFIYFGFYGLIVSMSDFLIQRLLKK